jgi:hypothetical protein
MSTRTLQRLISLTAFAAGLAVIAVAVSAWRMPEGGGRLGLDLRVIASSSGELSASPAGPFATATTLEPGRTVSGHTSFRNETGARVLVRARIRADNRGADRALWVELHGDGTRLYRGPLSGLRRWSPRVAPLAPAGHMRLAVRAWVSASSGGSYRGQIVDLPLELGTRTTPRPR